MITYNKGSLFSDDARVLVNTVNTVGVMSKGIALAFKKEFPHNFEIYLKACLEKQLMVGKLLIVPDYSLALGDRTIVNLPTKKHWKQPSAYSFIEAGLIALKLWLVENHVKNIAMPALGCGNGGLDWHRVKSIIAYHLKDLNIDIRLYEP